MNEFSPENQKEIYQQIENKKEYREQLEERYRNQENTAVLAIVLFTTLLLISSFAQFLILDGALGNLFDLDSSNRIFEISIKSLISLLVTAFLPVACIVDESRIQPEKSKFLGFIPSMWFLFLADIYLTFIAILQISDIAILKISSMDDIWINLTSLVIAAVLSISTSRVSRSIVQSFYKWKKARIDQKTVNIYGVDPKPLYKDTEQIKLSEEKEAAKQEAKEAREELKEEKARYEEELTSQETKYTQKIQGLEGKLINYKEYSDSLLEFNNSFKPVKKQIGDFASQSKNIFDKLSGLDESVKKLNFPQPPQIDIYSDNSKEVI